MKVKDFKIAAYDDNKGNNGYDILALTECGRLFQKTIPNNHSTGPWHDLTEDFPKE